MKNMMLILVCVLSMSGCAPRCAENTTTDQKASAADDQGVGGGNQNAAEVDGEEPTECGISCRENGACLSGQVCDQRDGHWKCVWP